LRLLILALVLLAGCASAPTRAFTARIPAIGERARLVVVGDFQRTSWLEFWRESNDRERPMIVAAIAEARADLLAVTGDLLFDGGSEARNAELDELLSPLHATNVPVIAAFGNHEYWEGRHLAESYFFDRITLAAHRHWYAVALGALRIVVLDSNISQFFAREWSEEVAWYEASLDAFDRDPSVRGVFVMMHHPPFTNSTITGDEAHVQRFFVPPFLHARKTLAMLCGHVHNYERFARGDKMFVVSGGGGGPRAPLATGDARRHTDDLFAGPPLRDFNFTIYETSAHGVDAEVRGLPKGGDAFHTMDRFTMPYR
jgi:Icc-related predicted phosphoesterase